MIIRKTKPEDIDKISEIYKNARAFMKDNGNPTQWNEIYPNRETAVEDMKNGVGYVCEENGEVLAVFMFGIGNDATYEKIYDGAWLDNEPYAVIHRIAVAVQGRRVAGFCFEKCFKLCPNLKIDTHEDNLPMQRALTRAGFVRCGTVYLENVEARIAYQKNK